MEKNKNIDTAKKAYKTVGVIGTVMAIKGWLDDPSEENAVKVMSETVGELPIDTDRINETIGQMRKYTNTLNNPNEKLKNMEAEVKSINLGDEIIQDNPQNSQLQTEQNSQIQAFIPQNLTQSEINEINEALEKYHITKQADKDTYLWDLDDKKPLFKGYIKNWFDALEKFTKNSDISAASNDFDKAVKQQENTLKELKEQLSFTEKNAIIRVFASKFHNVKTLENKKERVGVAMPKYYLDIISDYKRQIVRNFGEKIWQETFENFQKTSDLKVFENAVKSPLSQQNANLQISNENANLKNTNLQNSAGNVNSENNATNLQNLNNDFKM